MPSTRVSNDKNQVNSTHMLRPRSHTMNIIMTMYQIVCGDSTVYEVEFTGVSLNVLILEIVRWQISWGSGCTDADVRESSVQRWRFCNLMDEIDRILRPVHMSLSS